jgi:hypothetical protein
MDAGLSGGKLFYLNYFITLNIEQTVKTHPRLSRPADDIGFAMPV